VAAAAAYLQPLAVSSPTRAAVRDYDQRRSASLTRGWQRRGLRPGGRPSLYEDLRTAVGHASGQPPVKLEPLARFTWKKALALLGAFAVIYLVLPQLANAGAAVRALHHANWWWVLAALPALFVAQAFSTLLQLGSVPSHLPFGPTYVVSLGGSFLNRVTPNNVGGMALNFRYLQKAGVDSGAATGAVGLQTVAGLAANLLLIAVFFARTGHHNSGHFGFHIHQWVLVLITGVLVGGALFGLTPRGRRFYHDKIWGFIRSAGTAIAEVAKSPRHLALAGLGALGGPMVQIVALGLCVHALGGNLPFVQVGAVYLGGHLVASAAPVPGGLGAFEAAVVAGLSAIGMPVGAAASAVLIYRLLTYWLTIPVGWLSLKVAEGRGYV
jgi:glycosyltransferase 2 family protein